MLDTVQDKENIEFEKAVHETLADNNAEHPEILREFVSLYGNAHMDLRLKDEAGDEVTRRCTSSAHVYFLGTLVHSHSRTQVSPAQSSAGAEVYAMGSRDC